VAIIVKERKNHLNPTIAESTRVQNRCHEGSSARSESPAKMTGQDPGGSGVRWWPASRMRRKEGVVAVGFTTGARVEHQVARVRGLLRDAGDGDEKEWWCLGLIGEDNKTGRRP
jgi:hypothetical protein